MSKISASAPRPLHQTIRDPLSIPREGGKSGGLNRTYCVGFRFEEREKQKLDEGPGRIGPRAFRVSGCEDTQHHWTSDTNTTSSKMQH